MAEIVPYSGSRVRVPRARTAAPTIAPAAEQAGKRVLNSGSGPSNKSALPAIFRGDDWREVRLDINPAVGPDLVGSITDMRDLAQDATFDAIWSSHCLEHLPDHDLEPALSEFCRVLKPDGFALITCPDLQAVAQLVVDDRLEERAYVSPSGPIRALDMLFGHARSIAGGNAYMAHRTGLTASRLGRLCQAAGFFETRIVRGQNFDLWAVAVKTAAATPGMVPLLRGSELAFLLA